MKSIVVFANSAGFFVGDDPTVHFKNSYIDLLQNDFNVRGNWWSGLTILEVAVNIGWYARYYEPVVIHVGTCESITRPAWEIVKKCYEWTAFKAYTPAMVLIKKMLIKSYTEQNGYLHFINPSDFEELYNEAIERLIPRQCIMIGLGKPKGKEKWLEQVGHYNNLIKRIAENHSQHFIDVWNLCEGEIIDSTHLTQRGSRIIYEEIKCKI